MNDFLKNQRAKGLQFGTWAKLNQDISLNYEVPQYSKIKKSPKLQIAEKNAKFIFVASKLNHSEKTEGLDNEEDFEDVNKVKYLNRNVPRKQAEQWKNSNF